MASRSSARATSPDLRYSRSLRSTVSAVARARLALRGAGACPRRAVSTLTCSAVSVEDLWAREAALRGIKESPPYLHDGRLLTLEDTVEFFNLVLGVQLSRAEKADLVAYLRAL